MLIYDYKKEFIGIDKSSLELFNLSSLDELQKITNDFANFFTSKPGYIHNFEHIDWIDYILYNDSATIAKVIINIKDVNYSATLNIKTVFLTNKPDQQAYIVNFIDVKTLTDEFKEQKACDIKHQKDISYIFNPNIASKELGLPIDLVEEFVQDFVTQSLSFKTDIYDAISINNINKIKILSHKLKGVAANLRISNALEILTNINITEDFTQIHRYTDNFYNIIDILDKNVQKVDELVISFKESGCN